MPKGTTYPNFSQFDREPIPISAMAVGGEPSKSTHFEILMNISDENLTILANMYKRERGIPYASLVLTNGKKIRENHRYSLMRFMSVGNRWKDDGTFFVLMEFNNQYEMAIFSLDTSGRRIYDGLMKSKRIHFGRPIILRAIHRSLYPTVMKVLDEKNLKVASDVSQYIYCLPIEEAYRYEIKCPEGYELKPLEERHADQIDSLWTKRFEDSRTYLALFINLSGGWGLFKKSNDQLVSWSVRMALGNIGIVQTLEEYQKKGFASLVVQKIAKTIASEDESPTAFVPIGHEPSQLFFEKLGFQNLGTENTIELEKVDLSVKYSYSKIVSEDDSQYEIKIRESAL